MWLSRQRGKEMAEKAECLEILAFKSGVGMWDVILHNSDPADPKSRWTWSPEFRRLCGFATEAEFPNTMRSWSDRLHPDEAGAVMAAFRAALDGSKAMAPPYRLRAKDGTYRWFRAHGAVKRHPSGVAVRACST